MTWEERIAWAKRQQVKLDSKATETLAGTRNSDLEKLLAGYDILVQMLVEDLEQLRAETKP